MHLESLQYEPNDYYTQDIDVHSLYVKRDERVCSLGWLVGGLQDKPIGKNVLISLVAVFPRWIITHQQEILVALFVMVVATFRAARAFKFRFLAGAIRNKHLQILQVTNRSSNASNIILLNCKQGCVDAKMTK